MMEYRSDTFTKPTAEMLNAILTAELGDDVYGEDPTVNKLESFAASLVGKEAALLLPTCTMANLVAISVHCSERFSEIILGDKQHIHVYEVGGLASVAGVNSHLIPNESDGTMNLKAVEKAIRADSVHFPTTQMIAVENTHNACGGRVLPMGYLSSLNEIAKNHGVMVHMDGARLFNATTALQVTPAKICSYVDSVSICLSKGLSGPTGALLVGNKDFIKRARKARKVLGGSMRQSGIIAASGLIGLRTMSLRLEEDHTHARKIANALENLNDGSTKFFEILGGVESVQTNMFYFSVKDGKAPDFRKELEKNGVRVNHYGTTMIRMVTHGDVPLSNADFTIEALAKAKQAVFR